MRENDEITGLFRSRLAGAEMTVRQPVQVLAFREVRRL